MQNVTLEVLVAMLQDPDEGVPHPSREQLHNVHINKGRLQTDKQTTTSKTDTITVLIVYLMWLCIKSPLRIAPIIFEIAFWVLK